MLSSKDNIYSQVQSDESQDQLSSLCQIDIQEDVATSLSSSSSSDDKKSTSEEHKLLNLYQPIENEIFKIFKETSSNIIRFEIRLLCILLNKGNTKTYNIFQDVNLRVKAVNPTLFLSVKMSCPSQFIRSFKSNNLLVYSTEQYILAEENALGHLTGVASQSNSVYQDSNSVVGLNFPNLDRAEQTLIAQDFSDACLGLIRVRDSLTKLSKVSRNDLDEVFNLSLSFANIPKEIDRFELMSNHFRLVVGNMLMGSLSREVNLETSEPNNTIAPDATKSHQKEGHLLVENKDGASTHKMWGSKLAQFLWFFKEKTKTNSTKRGRFKSLFSCKSDPNE